MKDLGNERLMVEQKIREIDFEPVNAENWLPSGGNSWLKIQEEINSSHIFVLIIGERYGWIPPEGAGRSVTHLEFLKAREIGLPILPFLKTLSFDTERESDDAKRRDEFRKEITDWSSGQFVSEFNLAPDLAIKVGHTLVGVLQESFLRSEVQRRTILTRPYEERLRVAKRAGSIKLPEPLIAAAKNHKLILIAGDGVSVAAGLPSDKAMSEVLASRLELDDLSGRSVAAIPFPLMAEIYIQNQGYQWLEKELQQLMTGLKIEPTQFHLQSVKLFKRILTTNFDETFETAYRTQHIPFELIEPRKSNYSYEQTGALITSSSGRSRASKTLEYSDLSANLLFKLRGTVENHREELWVETSLLTLRDLWTAYGNATSLKSIVPQLLRGMSPVVIGMDLQNPEWEWLIDWKLDEYHAAKATPSYLVLPSLNRFDRFRFERRPNIKVIESEPEEFINALSAAVALSAKDTSPN